MKLGNLDIKGIYVGSTPAAQVYVGNVKAWPEEQPQPVTVNAVRFQNVGNTIGKVQLNPADQLSGRADWEYSSDGTSWTTWNKTQIQLSVQPNESLYVRAGSTGQNTLAYNASFNGCNRILPTDSDFKVSGNIMYLLKQDGVVSANRVRYQFSCLFLQGTGIVDASELSLPSRVDDQSMTRMFGVCTKLSAAPQLPANTLSSACYQFMFVQCTSLSTPPALPANNLAGWCYYNMFYGCTALTSAPALTANVREYCYAGMFSGCTSLKAVPQMLLATNNGSYQNMFYGCTSLTSTGYLTANGLGYVCYSYMFANSGIISAYFPDAYPQQLSGDQYAVFGKNSQCGGLTMFDGLDPSQILVTYAGGTELLSSFLPKQEVQGVKFTATLPYTNIQIEDVGNAAAAGGICDVVYSTDGENWTNYTVGDTITLENTDDYVIFKAASEQNSGIMSISSTEYFKFVVDSLPLVEGDLKYLYTTDPENYYMTHDYQFTHLFYECYFAIQYNGMYSSLTMPSQDDWIYSGISYVFDQIFRNAQIARITIPSSRNSNDWDSYNAFHWWVAGIYTDGETGILTLPSFYSITYGENSIPNGWSYEQIS